MISPSAPDTLSPANLRALAAVLPARVCISVSVVLRSSPFDPRPFRIPQRSVSYVLAFLPALMALFIARCLATAESCLILQPPPLSLDAHHVPATNLALPDLHAVALA